MQQSPFIDYGAPFVDSTQMAADSLASSFITQGFGRAITPLPRVNYDILEGWNLALIGVILLLIVMNKQLYPRQFRQVLSLPGGTAHTNQLLREWSPKGSFMGSSFVIAYVVVMAMFVQKSFVVLSRDVLQYNDLRTFLILSGIMLAWVLLRLLMLRFMGWLFGVKDVVERQEAVQLSATTYSLILMLPVLLLLLYNPYSLFVWIGCGIISAAALMRFVLEFLETRFSTKIAPLYIFLYFCALEIAPVAILLTAGLRFFGHGSVF
jgi:hypothetical protein